MHIPDGFLDAKTAVTTGVLSAAGVAVALRQVRHRLPPRRRPQLGLVAAFLFVAQMLNFPVAGGTSGHLLGGTLAAALLGPAAAVVVVTAVLIVQCFLFQDGGVLALGANLFNMAIIGAAGGGLVYRGLCRRFSGTRGQVTAVAFAGWCSTVMAAVCCAGQLAWSGLVAWTPAVLAMAGVHALIGIGEGLISALVLLAILRTRPDMVLASAGEARSGPDPGAWGYGLLATLGLAVFVVPFACPWPDGLESVAERLGFQTRVTAPILPAPAPDYELPGLDGSAGSAALAAVAGSLIVFIMAWWLGRLLVPVAGTNASESDSPS